MKRPQASVASILICGAALVASYAVATGADAAKDAQPATQQANAAVLQELDLIIMTDSSVVHLAGALGRPVWNLLAYDAYWLYMTGRSDSPWYPSLRLFRQPQPGDWESVFKEVEMELKKTAATKSSS